jgi:putative membrane protein
MLSLLKYWHLDILMTVYLVIICIGYFYVDGFKDRKKSVYFFIGYGLIILSVASPLHFLGENYLMSAHMASHVILLLIAAPFLVAGVPESRDKHLILFSERLAKYPWLPWMAGVCIMWFWHIPGVFNRLFHTVDLTAGHSHPINLLSDIHLMSLVFAGILFSWPVLGPVKSARIPSVNAVLYLSAACIFCSVLGLLITFAPMGTYTHYEHITDQFGFLQMIRDENGISAVVDQQMAGLIMWVPGCVIYLTASMWLLMKWFKEKNGKPILVSSHKINP